MALASYFGRVHDAVASLGTITGPELGALLGRTAIRVELAPAAGDAAWRPGVELLGNVLGRLYPTLAVSGPAEAADAFRRAVQLSNPAIEMLDEDAAATTTLRFGDHAPGGDVSVTASAWLVSVDGADDGTQGPPQPLAALAAACVAAGEVFREVFRDVVEGGRSGPQPGLLELVTGDPRRPAPDVGAVGVRLPAAVLAGAGAVGQAAVLAFAASGAVGELTVVDPEDLELSNVQRYVLSSEADVGTAKVDLVRRRLEGAAWTVDAVRARWGEDPRGGPRRGVVLVALDTARDRLAVAAGLHKTVYNAWTQPADLGWSRHESFGDEPCLACLYYPASERPSDDELIAAAVRQPRLRVLSYLVTGAPIGLPLPQIVPVADVPVPPGAEEWLREPLVDALTASGIVPPDARGVWAARSVGELYTAGICGGGLVAQDRQGLPAEVVVPLAHQSALAGVMLALQLIAAEVPALREVRHRAVEGRLDLMTGLPQVTPRPRERTRGCFCSDPMYLAAAR